MTTANYTIPTIHISGPQPSENISESSNLTPTTPSNLSDSKSISDSTWEQLMNEKETMMKQMELSNSELNDLKNKLLQAARQKQALNKAHVKITELEAKVSELTEENAKLKLQNQQNEEVVKSSHKHQIIIEQSVNEIRALTSKIIEAEKAIHHFEQENQEYKVKLERVLNALNNSEETKEDLWATIEEQEKLLSSQNNALAQLQKQLNEAQTQNSLKDELAQSQKDIRQLKLHNIQLQALLKEKSQELEQNKLDIPSIRIESERSLTDRFLPGTPSTACSRSMTNVPKTPNSSSSGKIKFIRMKKESMTMPPQSTKNVDIEKRILSVLTEKRKLTRNNDNLAEKIKEQKKEFDQRNYFTTILNAPQSARVSRLPNEWEENEQASPLKSYSRLIVKREVAHEELRRKNKSVVLLERGNAPIHAL